MGWRNILLTPVDPPLNGYRAGERVRTRVTIHYPSDGPALGNWPFVAMVYRPRQGGTDRDQWYFQTDADGSALVDLTILAGHPPGFWTLHVFLMKPLPDGSWDGDGWTFPVVADATG